MNKFITVFAAVILLSAIIATARLSAGYGKIVTLSTTPQIVWVGTTNQTASRVKIVNMSATAAEIVYFNINTTTNDFSTATAIPISSSAAFDGANIYTSLDGYEIKSIVIASATGTPSVYLAFE